VAVAAPLRVTEQDQTQAREDRAVPVRRIDQGGRLVRVHTARGVVEARRVVVAVPPPLVLDIDWSPGLPDQRRRLMRSLDMGRLMKCDAVYKTPFWRKDGLNGFGISDSGAARAVFDNSPKDGTPGVLLAFVGGSTWRQFDAWGDTEYGGQRTQGFGYHRADDYGDHFGSTNERERD
jgi:monoamine oxidase